MVITLAWEQCKLGDVTLFYAVPRKKNVFDIFQKLISSPAEVRGTAKPKKIMFEKMFVKKLCEKDDFIPWK